MSEMKVAGTPRGRWNGENMRFHRCRTGCGLGALLRAGIALGLLGQQVMVPRPASGATFEFVDQVKISGGVPGAGKVLTSDANGLATWETAPADGSVTSAKLAADAVTSVKIADGAVTTVKLADDSVTRSKLAADSCTDGQILKLNASGEWVCAVEGGGGVPSTAVMFFNNTACPSGWTAISAAQGRYLVGLPTSGTLAGTTGTALTNGENRSVGQHNHSITDPGHTHTFLHRTDTGCFAGCSGFAWIETLSMDSGSSPTGISVNLSGSTAGTNAPYIQFLVCQKD